MNGFIAPLASLLGAGCAADAPEADPVAAAAEHPHAGFAFITSMGGHPGALISLFGFALLVFLLAPERNRLAAERACERPLTCVAWGALLLLPPALALLWVLHHTVAFHGRGVLAVYLIISSAAGLSVCARALAERAAPQWSAMAQVLVGLAALVLSLACVLGLPVLLIAAPLGLGAWISARVRQSAP